MNCWQLLLIVIATVTAVICSNIFSVENAQAEMKLILLISLLFVVLLCCASLANNIRTVPVVLWHGMGDSCCSRFSLGRLKKLVEKNLPADVYVLSLRIGNNIIEDIENGFTMNVNLQVQDACKQIANDEKLRKGFNAIGFSQGSQFLRAVAQRCPDPPMFNLISIGGQHQGVFGVPHCIHPNHVWCEDLRKLLSYGAYLGWVQEKFVQAAYWHDPLHEEEYINKSIFLADINNEQGSNYDYRKNLMTLRNFVLVMFEDDQFVVPKETSWFGYYAPGQDVNIINMTDSVLYRADRIGLKYLNENQKLHFVSLPGDHLQFTEEWFIQEIVKKYLST